MSLVANEEIESVHEPEKLEMGKYDIEVKVTVADRNLKVGAMARALAFAIGSQKSVAGATNDFLELNGFLLFHFPFHSIAKEFRKDISYYLDIHGARTD